MTPHVTDSWTEDKTSGPFKAPAVLTLNTMEEVKAVLDDPNWKKNLGSRNHYRVRSAWIISLIHEIMGRERRTLAYNAEVKKLAEERMGLPPQSDKYYATEGGNLSALIYSNQCFRRSDEFIAKGYVPLTQELIDASTPGTKFLVEEQCNWATNELILTVREVEGKPGEKAVFRDASNTSIMYPANQPAKLLPNASRPRKKATA